MPPQVVNCIQSASGGSGGGGGWSVGTSGDGGRGRGYLMREAGERDIMQHV